MKDEEKQPGISILPKTEVPGLAHARKLVVGVIGFTVLLVGICLLVLPGPAFLVIPTGLAILATEFVWARRWLRKAKKALVEVKESCLDNGNSQDEAKQTTSRGPDASSDGRS